MTAVQGTVRLDGKVALITGASRGIGAAAAHAFARAGASVALAARDAGALERVADEVTAAGGTALAVPADVTDERQVAALVRTVTGQFGALHLAFNNAGGSLGMAPLAEIRTETFDRTVEVNLRGVFLCLKYEVPAMLEAGGGAIVNTSSLTGLRAGVPGIASYAAAKHGLHGLTEAAALDYASRGVRVNALALGPIDAGYLPGAPDEHRDAAARAVPMHRIGTPGEVAAAAVWLCCEQAGFITGATLPVDGGMLAGRA